MMDVSIKYNNRGKEEYIYIERSYNRLISNLFRKAITWLALAMMFKYVELLGDTTEEEEAEEEEERKKERKKEKKEKKRINK